MREGMHASFPGDFCDLLIGKKPHLPPRKSLPVDKYPSEDYMCHIAKDHRISSMAKFMEFLFWNCLNHLRVHKCLLHYTFPKPLPGWFGSSSANRKASGQRSDWSSLCFIYTKARQWLGCSSHANRVSMGWDGMERYVRPAGAMPRAGELRCLQGMHLVLHKPLVSWGGGELCDANCFSSKAHPCTKPSQFTCIHPIC